MVDQKLGAHPRAVNARLSTSPRTSPPPDLDTVLAPLAAAGASSRRSPLIRTIQDAALDQDVDPVKFDRLLSAQERMAGKEARMAFDAAFAAMQAELPVIEERGILTDSAGKPTSSYALWEDINEAIKPVLGKFGFGLRFRTGQDHNTIVVTAMLSHAAGHAEETTLRLPTDLSGGKNALQAIGSSTSYGKRYTASALLNITSKGEDDDGKAALESSRITERQVAELRGLLKAANRDERRLCSYLAIPTLEALPPSRFERARDALTLPGDGA